MPRRTLTSLLLAMIFVASPAVYAQPREARDDKTSPSVHSAIYIGMLIAGIATATVLSLEGGDEDNPTSP